MAPPMTADRIVSQLRRYGVKVVEVAGWRTHNRNHIGGWGPVNGVMIHHTVTSGAERTVEMIRDGYEGLPGPLALGAITKDGTVHLVGHGRANHAGGGDGRVFSAVVHEGYGARPPAPGLRNVDGNTHFYGFECENLGDGEDPWPAVQLDAIERASAALCDWHGWSEKSVIGHLEWTDQKVDPRGFGMQWMRERIGNRIGNPEDGMALTKDDLETLAKTDGIFKSPHDDSHPNRFWTLESYQRETYLRLKETKAAVQANRVAISELARALAAQHREIDADALVARIEQKIESVVVTLDVAD